MALSFGALYPQFGTENAAQIPTSFGGLVYMMSTLSLLAVVIMIEAIPVTALPARRQRWSTSRRHQPSWQLALLAAALLLIGATFVPLRMALPDRADRDSRWGGDRRSRRSLQRYRHPSDTGHAPGHGGSRSGRRAAAEDPTVNPAAGHGGRAAGQGSGAIPSLGHDVQPGGLRGALPGGDEILLQELAHPLLFEVGGAAAMIGAVLRPLAGPRGFFTADQVRAAVRPPAYYMPRTRAVSIEQTATSCGGMCWPMSRSRRSAARPASAGLAAHMDGARLFNAVVATGTRPRDSRRRSTPSGWTSARGSGAGGAVLAGSRGFVAEAWRCKQRFGGAMRQAGIIAAAGLYALEHHVARLAEDHERARRLAHGLAEIPGVAWTPTGSRPISSSSTSALPASPRKRSPSGRWRGAACASP